MNKAEGKTGTVDDESWTLELESILALLTSKGQTQQSPEDEHHYKKVFEQSKKDVFSYDDGMHKKKLTISNSAA